MEKLVEEGKWKFLTNETFGRYDNMKEETVGRFVPTEA